MQRQGGAQARCGLGAGVAADDPGGAAVGRGGDGEHRIGLRSSVERERARPTALRILGAAEIPPAVGGLHQQLAVAGGKAGRVLRHGRARARLDQNRRSLDRLVAVGELHGGRSGLGNEHDGVACRHHASVRQARHQCQGSRRQVAGELRRWVDALPASVRIAHDEVAACDGVHLVAGDGHRGHVDALDRVQRIDLLRRPGARVVVQDRAEGADRPALAVAGEGDRVELILGQRRRPGRIRHRRRRAG